MAVFHDEVEIEDFEYDEESESYFYPCPCGDQFEITKVCTAALIKIIVGKAVYTIHFQTFWSEDF